jgi:putative ABC transport system permease protein
MLKNYLRLAFRSIWNRRFYSALNIMGLSLSMAGGLILFQFIHYHLSFDQYHQKAGELYRVVTDLHLDDGTVEYEKGAPVALPETLEREMPQVKGGAVLLKIRSMAISVPEPGGAMSGLGSGGGATAHGSGGGATAHGSGGMVKNFQEQDNAAYADKHWFELFDYTWLQGNPQTALKDPHSVVITESTARKYFGDTDPMGKPLRMDSRYDLVVTGVLKDYPENTDTKIDLFISRPSMDVFYAGLDQQMNRDWTFINSTTQAYVWIPAAGSDASAVSGSGTRTGSDASAVSGSGTRAASVGTRVPAAVEAGLARMPAAHLPADIAHAFQYHLQPLHEVHFDARYGATTQKSLLLTLGIAGLFLVLIACFNFINMATAQSVRRSREIGTRKVLGGSTALIFWQFISETATMAILALCVAVGWIALVLPLIHQNLDIPLQFNLARDPLLIGAALGMLVLVIVAGGAYPALVLSRWNPIDALKRQVASGKHMGLRKGLILTQNVVVQVLIISTLVIALQVRHIKTADPGFNKEHVLMVSIPDTAKGKMDLLRNQWQQIPGVESVSFCFQAPMSPRNLEGSTALDHRPWENFMAHVAIGDSSYLKTFQLHLLVGRNIRASDTVDELLVNETLVHKFGIKEPSQILGHHVEVGAEYTRGVVVGVLKDFNIRPMYMPVEPSIIASDIKRYDMAAIRVSAGSPAALMGRLQSDWQLAYPDRVYQYHFLDEQLDDYYQKESQLGMLINATSAVAIVISCLGLLGLISFFALQRTREIGIRKVLGASVTHVIYLLTQDFLKLVLISLLLSIPIAWWFMQQWLRDFAYRIDVSWWIFALAGLSSAIIAFGTVGYQAWKAATANPADSLRTE